MVVGGEIRVGGGTGIAPEIETGRSHFRPVGYGDHASGSDAFLRKGVCIGRGAVFELGLRCGCTSKRGKNREKKDHHEKKCTMHVSHPLGIRASTSHLNDAL